MVWTVRQIAEATNLTPQHITRLLRSGKIEGERLTSGWIVYDEEAERFVQERKANAERQDQDQ